VAHTIHHVTAVTAEIRRNLEYYTRVLGLRLVKKSVNQDDVSAYHLFYADAVGTPGTDMTFFDWPKAGPNFPGAGTVSLTTFRVPTESLHWWEERLAETASSPEHDVDEEGRDRLTFTDPEGQRLALVAEGALPTLAQPWTVEVPGERAIRGILGVDIESGDPEATRRVLTELLGYRAAAGDTLAAGDAAHAARVRVFASPVSRRGRVGSGGVHHVAFRVRDDEELREMERRVEAFGLRTSGQIDRFYFHSLYFREPGGVLFELATDGPGFAADEEMDALGERLALPPFLEDQRKRIEAGLKPI
jgi:glyoxalase family protein